MSLLEFLYKKNKRRCPSCLELIYPGDCEIRGEIPQGVLLKRAPRLWKKDWARMFPEPLIGEEYTIHQAHRKCPKCGYYLPYNFESARSLIIAIVGGNQAGKTHYIAALIDEIQQGKLTAIHQFSSFTCLTTEALKDKKQLAFDFIKMQKVAAPPTPSIYDTSPDPFQIKHNPLIYEIGLKLSQKVLATTLNLVIYDNYGEDYKQTPRLVTAARYVLNSDALIFVADPVSMPKIFDRINKLPNEFYGTPQGNPAEDFNTIMREIEKFRKKRVGASLANTPVAIMLSKSDLLDKLRHGSTPFYFKTEPSYDGGIDLQDIEKVNKEVLELLETVGETGLIRASGSLKSRGFFATSATGQPPDMTNKAFTAIHPRRCLDPVLWILYKKGFLSDPNELIY